MSRLSNSLFQCRLFSIQSDYNPIDHLWIFITQLFAVIRSMNILDHMIDYMYRNRKTLQLLLGVLIAILITITELKAQNTEGFIYGKVYTRSSSYIGQIRWGKEEAFWTDHFNAEKVDNTYESFRAKEKDKSLDWRLSSIWEDLTGGTTHVFSCQFGDLKEIVNYGDERVRVMLKNGEVLKISGSGYNDIGSSITMYDDELGRMSIKWDRITKVEFLPTPQNLANNFGTPLMGTVETLRKGNLTGLIQWDHDERLGKDKLDGDTKDGDVSIPFSQIRRIEQRGRGSMVTLKSGREFYVSGSNDVNPDNKGIIVTIDGIGKIDVPWKAFQSVTFEKLSHSGASYTSFSSPKELKGTVYQYNDKQVSGRIVFDIDESLDLELLEGYDDEVEYKIPFRNIRSIEPKNYNYSMVELKNGKQLLLGRGRDVTDDNAGLLVFRSGSREPFRIDWTKITKIVFE